MPLVHGLDLPPAAQAPHRNVTVGPVRDAQGAHMRRVQADVGGCATGELLIPEGGAGGGELVGD